MRRRPTAPREVRIFLGLALLLVLGFAFLIVCVAARVYDWDVPGFMRSIGETYLGLVWLCAFIGFLFGRKRRR